MADRSGPDDPGAGAGKAPKGGKAPRPLSGRKRADAGGRSAEAGRQAQGQGRPLFGGEYRPDRSGRCRGPARSSDARRTGPSIRARSRRRGPGSVATVQPATGCAWAAPRAVEALRRPGWAARPTHRPAPGGPPVRRATRASPRPGSAAIHGWWASASLVRAIGSTPRSASAVPRRTAEGPWRPTALPRRATRLVAARRTGDQARRRTAVVRRRTAVRDGPPQDRGYPPRDRGQSPDRPPWRPDRPGGPPASRSWQPLGPRTDALA